VPLDAGGGAGAGRGWDGGGEEGKAGGAGGGGGGGGMQALGTCPVLLVRVQSNATEPVCGSGSHLYVVKRRM
jgi:hypothetical protein